MPAPLHRDDEITALYAEGLSQSTIARRLGIGQTTVSRRLRALGVPMNPRHDLTASTQNLAKVNEALRNPHIELIGVTGKVCRKCEAWQPLAEFIASKNTWDGLENRCRSCRRKRKLADYHRNREAIGERRRSPEYRDRFRPWYRQWERDKRATDLNYRLAKAVRGRVRAALKGRRKHTTTLQLLGCSLDQLREHLEARFADGMTWDNYGRGGWEIDHIRPCASFDLADPRQLAECFHYTNLQPLWGPDNWAKGARVARVA